MHTKIKAVLVASGLAVLGVVSAHLVDFNLSPELSALAVAVIGVAAGYLKRA